MSRRGRRIGLLVFGAIVALAATALARPGGGHSYGGGGGGGSSGGGSSGGGGDAGALIYLLVRLVIDLPYVGVPLLVVIAIVVAHAVRSQTDLRAAWDSGAVRSPPPPVAIDLEPLRGLDPGFSQVLFEDFLFRLASQTHRARATPAELAALAPYVAEPVRAALATRPGSGAPIADVVIGALRVIGFEPPAPPPPDAPGPGFVQLAVELELEVAGATTGWYLREEWRLRRAADVRTRAPGAARTFPCPNCGAPFASSDGHACAYCAQVVDNGRFDWLVHAIVVHEQRERRPATVGTIPEHGTDLPTRRHPEADARLAALLTDDPAVTDVALDARLRAIHGEITTAWNMRDLPRLRPWVSDGLYDALRYQLEAYARAGLANRVDDPAVTRWAVAKVVRDAAYDALTLRLWATGKDSTSVLATGRVVGGSTSRPRPYSEYWTVIRGAAARGAPRADRRCPNCGAELKIAMGGTCAYCEVHVTAGEFDWVLSKIEQDDAYVG
jgi:hypothetical protein